MKAFLSLDRLGSFPGHFWGWRARCAGEIAHFQAPSFAPQILTDPSYLDKIIVVDVDRIDNRWPMPEEAQSFMPHLAGLVFLGQLNDSEGAGEHFTLRNYLDINRIPAFVPDDPMGIRRALSRDNGIAAAIGRGRVSPGRSGAGHNFRTIASPQEYIWDLAPGEMPQEIAGLVVWDHGVNYGLLRALKKVGASLRVVPPDTEPERIIALHPDGVVIAGGPFPAEPGATLSRIERIIGIRPTLAVGTGALLVCRALGIAVEPLSIPHYGSAAMVNESSGGEIETYQAHAYAPSRLSLEKAGCEITHVNANDDTVEGFSCPDYDVTAMIFTMTSESVPRVLREYMAGLQKQAVV